MTERDESRDRPGDEMVRLTVAADRLGNSEASVRKLQPEEQAERALCLSLLTDAVILWNTARYREILEGLRAEGYTVNDEDVAHLSGGCRERAANTT